MNSILNHAVALYDDGGADAVWTYFNWLIMTGVIEEGTAEQIAYMAEHEA